MRHREAAQVAQDLIVHPWHTGASLNVQQITSVLSGRKRTCPGQVGMAVCLEPPIQPKEVLRQQRTENTGGHTGVSTPDQAARDQSPRGWFLRGCMWLWSHHGPTDLIPNLALPGVGIPK